MIQVKQRLCHGARQAFIIVTPNEIYTGGLVTSDAPWDPQVIEHVRHLRELRAHAQGSAAIEELN